MKTQTRILLAAALASAIPASNLLAQTVPPNGDFESAPFAKNWENQGATPLQTSGREGSAALLPMGSRLITWKLTPSDQATLEFDFAVAKPSEQENYKIDLRAKGHPVLRLAIPSNGKLVIDNGKGMTYPLPAAIKWSDLKENSDSVHWYRLKVKLDRQDSKSFALELQDLENPEAAPARAEGLTGFREVETADPIDSLFFISGGSQDGEEGSLAVDNVTWSTE